MVTLDYLGQVWGAPYPFEDTYRKEPTTVPLGAGLGRPRVGACAERRARGSRVLLVAPPELAATGTGSPPGGPEGARVAYLIDVLGVS